MRRWIRDFPTRKALVVLAIVLAAPPLPLAQQPGTQAQPPGGPAQQPGAQAQQPDGGPPPFRPEELEQIVAPIALYPDPLVAQVMMASTYPIEVIQCARLVKGNPNLKGDALNEELKRYDWDDSVKSLASLGRKAC